MVLPSCKTQAVFALYVFHTVDMAIIMFRYMRQTAETFQGHIISGNTCNNSFSICQITAKHHENNIIFGLIVNSSLLKQRLLPAAYWMLEMFEM